MRIFKTGLELLYPGRCPACDRVLRLSEEICRDCEQAFSVVSDNYCMKCGKSLENKEAEYCSSCLKIRHRFTAGRALYDYKSVNKSIYRFKYSGRAEYAGYFGKQLADHFREDIERWKPEVIAPVPIHRSRLKKRGYNQAALLAKIMAKNLNLPYDEKLVIRQRKTTPMKELNSLERQINLKNSFIVRDNDVKLKRVLLVDDIYTSGSTIDAITAELKKAGVQDVFFVTLSIGSGV